MKKPTNGNRGNLIKTFRKELLNKRAELLLSLGINSKRQADAERTSEEDRSTVSKDEFLQSRLDRVFYGDLRQVESALALLDLGVHGTCAECSASISSKRMRAVPWATYCVDCQDKAADGKAQELGSLALTYWSRSNILPGS
jgi:DnaK suppressor protein